VVYDKMMQFSAVDNADLLAPTPLLVIADSKAETLEHSELLYEHAQDLRSCTSSTAAYTSTSTTARSTSASQSPRSTSSSRATSMPHATRWER
jgi:hypothetical protein